MSASSAAIVVPRASGFRLVGTAAANAKGRFPAPANAAFRDDADAYAVVLGPGEEDVASIARALPAPDDLPEGTLVVVYPAVVEAPSFAKRLIAAIGRGRAVPRVTRCSALLARGYVRIGAGVDADTRLDLAWGYSPAPFASSSRNSGVTERG